MCRSCSTRPSPSTTTIRSSSSPTPAPSSMSRRSDRPGIHKGMRVTALRLLSAVCLLALGAMISAGPALAAPPRANFRADTNRGEVPLPVRLENTTTGGAGPVRFQWDFGDGGRDTSESPTHVYTAPGNFTVTLTATDATGAADTKQDVITVDGPTLVAALLPASRSVVVGAAATAFVTVINAGAVNATGVSIRLDPTTGPGGAPLPAALVFQTTDPTTNAVTGSPNVAVDIPAGGSQSFVIAVTPAQTLPPTDVRLNIAGSNSTR